jgi:hypothetical protein
MNNSVSQRKRDDNGENQTDEYENSEGEEDHKAKRKSLHD